MKRLPTAAAVLIAALCGAGPVVPGPAQAPFDRAGRAPKGPAVRCFTPQGETIPAQKVLDMLADGKDVDLQGRIIEGSLDADAIWPAVSDERKTSLRAVQGRFRCNSCRITGRVAFPHTVLMQGLDLTCSEVLGDVDLSDSDVRSGVIVERSKILGGLRLNRAMVDGDIQLRGATIDDRVDMNGVRASLIAMPEADLRRDVDLSHTVVVVVNLSSARIAGSMKIQDVLVMRSFVSNGASFARGFSLESVRVYGAMDLSESAGATATLAPPGSDTGDAPGAPAVFTLADLRVEGQLMLALASGSALTMTDVTARQGLVLLDGTFGEVSMTGIHTGGDSTFDGAQFLGKLLIADADFGKRFSATEVLFKGDVEFRRVKFPGDDPLEGATFASTPVLTDTVLPKPPNVKGEEAEPAADPDADDEPDDDE